MKQNRIKIYFTYKSLSNELFNDLPSVDIEGIASWEAARRGALYKDLLVRFLRNKRCAELRAEYRDNFVALGDRDEQHEFAIAEAERRAAFYLRKMEKIAVALQTKELEKVDISSSLPDDWSHGVESGRGQMRKKLKEKKAKGKKEKRRKNGVEAAVDLPSLIAEDFSKDPDFWSKVREEAYGHAAGEVDVLYDRLLREIVHFAKARLGKDPGARVVHTLAKYVLSCFGLRSGANMFDEQTWVDWTTAALRRLKDCKDGHLR